MERAEQTGRLHDHPHRGQSREQRWSDFYRAAEKVRSRGFPQEEEEARIRKLGMAHLGVDFALEGNEYVSGLANTPSGILTEEAPKPQRRTRFE